MKFIKTQLIRLANNSVCLVPLEEVKNGFFDMDRMDDVCEFIKINPPKVNLWVYRSYNGINCIGNEDHTVSPPTEEEFTKIAGENHGVCYLEADDTNELSCPSNGQGYRSLVIRLSLPNAQEVTA